MFAEQGRGERMGPGGNAERINTLLFAPSIDDTCGDVRKMRKKILQQTLHSEYFEGHEKYRESGINIDSESTLPPNPRESPARRGQVGFERSKTLATQTKEFKIQSKKCLAYSLPLFLCF